MPITTLQIPPYADVLVCDARRALFLSNGSDETYPNLAIREVLDAPANPPARDHGTDRPGRSMSGGRRSALDAADAHDLAEADFARLVAAALARRHEAEPSRKLILVAPPAFLGELRKRLPHAVQDMIVAEVSKDLIHLPVHEIEAALTRE